MQKSYDFLGPAYCTPLNLLIEMLICGSLAQSSLPGDAPSNGHADHYKQPFLDRDLPASVASGMVRRMGGVNGARRHHYVGP